MEPLFGAGEVADGALEGGDQGGLAVDEVFVAGFHELEGEGLSGVLFGGNRGEGGAGGDGYL